MNELNIQPLNPAISSAKFKQTADDFMVKEILDIEFDGTGEHLWLFIKKSHVNTAFVVKLLSDWANIKPSDIGFSGLKDRHATTYQWFSLRIPQKTLPQIAFNDFIQINFCTMARPRFSRLSCRACKAVCILSVSGKLSATT